MGRAAPVEMSNLVLDQYYLECLSHASYLVGDRSSGRAVVVDPRRDVGDYLADAEALGLTIELVLETHFHADFLSGHLELAHAAGAVIAFADTAITDFPSRGLAHGERIELGEVVIEVRHTPGHTPESTSFVVWAHPDDAEPYGVLTGDTLFVGDVGRPDLLSSVGVSKEELATKLYDSVHEQLLTLPDATRVFPAHGAGSSCGKNLSSETWSTIGEQRRTNPALLASSREEFIEMVTTGQPPCPAYFAHDADLNRRDRALLDEDHLPAELTVAQARSLAGADAVLLDTREAEEFARGHLPGSVNVGLGGRFAEFAGSVLSPETLVVIVADEGRALETKNRLARIGFDRVAGYVPAGTWADEDSEPAERLGPADFDRRRSDSDVQLVDVRHPGEYSDGTIPGASSLPVAQLLDRLRELDPARPTLVFCAGGYRSSVAASLMRGRGFTDVADLIGGIGAWREHTPA